MLVGLDHLQLTVRGMVMELSINGAVDHPSLKARVLIAKGYRGRHGNKEAMTLRKIVLSELAV